MQSQPRPSKHRGLCPLSSSLGRVLRLSRLILLPAVKSFWLKSPLSLLFGPPHPGAQWLLLVAETHAFPDEITFRHNHSVIPHLAAHVNAPKCKRGPSPRGPHHCYGSIRTIGEYRDNLVSLCKCAIMMSSLQRTRSPPNIW